MIFVIEIQISARELVDLLKSGLFEEFRSKFQRLVKEGVHTPFELTLSILLFKKPTPAPIRKS